MKAKSIYQHIALFSLVCLVTFSVITYLFSNAMKNYLDLSVNTYIADNFAEDIRYYQIRGNSAEVYKKCKKLSQKKLVNFLEVKDAAGETICSFGAPGKSSLKQSRKIYFSNLEDDLLATVAIEFNTYFQDIVIFIASTTVFFFFSIFLLAGVFLFKKSISFLTYPFERFINRIKVLGIDEEGLSYFSHLKTYQESNQIYALIQRLVSSSIQQQEKSLKDNEQNVTTEISRQVLHDIRSPLAALKMLSQQEAVDKEIFRFAISRVEQIANDLSLKTQPEQFCFVHFTTLQLIQEKLIEFKGRDLKIDYHPGTNTMFKTTNLSEIELTRMLSNLINNSVEACEAQSCLITIELLDHGDKLILSLEDNGPGIPPEKQSEALLRGVSFKHGGSGLGLHHCLITLQKKHGALALSTSRHEGLKITMELKRSQIPETVFASDINLSKTIHIIDDEVETYLRLKEKTDAILKYYPSPEQARKHLETFTEDLVLVDYNFNNSQENGITLIQDIPSPNKFLLTNDFDNKTVTDLAQTKGVRIIPKPYLEFIISSFIRAKKN